VCEYTEQRMGGVPPLTPAAFSVHRPSLQPVEAGTNFRARNPFIIMTEQLTWPPINTRCARTKSFELISSKPIFKKGKSLIMLFCVYINVKSAKITCLYFSYSALK
jgi:hypothetical protein